MSKRPLKVWRFSVASYHSVGFAPSRAAFARIAGLTTTDMGYVSNTSNPKDVALAEQAGEGHYMKLTRSADGKRDWVRCQSKETAANALLDSIKLMVAGGGNAPPMRIEKGEPMRGAFSSQIDRLVFIGDEQRGYWRRLGSRWTLYDTTGYAVPTSKDFYVYENEVKERDKAGRYKIMMNGWDEAGALRHVLQAWEEDQLPDVAEQKARAEKRNNASSQKQARKAALERLLPEYEALERVMKRAVEAGIPEAAFIFDILTSSSP